MIPFAGPRYVDGLSLRVPLGRWRGLRDNRQRRRDQQRECESKRGKQVAHREPPGGKIFVLRRELESVAT